MNTRSVVAFGTGILSVVVLAGCQKTESVNPPQASTATATSPAAGTATAAPSYPTRPYFGDTHLHTAISLDAGAAGDRPRVHRVRPDELRAKRADREGRR